MSVLLVLANEERAIAQDIIDYAKQRKHWYYPAKSKQTPGDNPAHVAQLGKYRCVFSYSMLKEGLHRHLSISSPTGGLPQPYVVFLLADLFGFTGRQPGDSLPPKDWVIGPHFVEQCIVVGQKLPVQDA